MDNTARHGSVSRRTMLGGVLGGAVAAAGLSAAPTASAHGDLVRYSGIWGQDTRSEISGDLTSYSYRPSFHTRLGEWLEFWYLNTPSNVLKPLVVWSIGVHVDDGGDEGHVQGRAIDISRIYCANGDGDRVRTFNGRYDEWRTMDEGAAKNAVRKRYWATTASANYYFRDVLHYAYNQPHWNHIHIDNTESDLGFPHYNTDSRAQTLHVQSCCRHIWGLPTTVDGVWGDQTRTHSTRVLRAVGKDTGTLTTSTAHWQAFNRGSLREGYGTQNYPAP